MYKILSSYELTSGINQVIIESVEIARKARAGQFVVVRIDELGERIPLTLADWNIPNGTITLVAMRVGTSTAKLAKLKQGDHILNLVGPLGTATHIENYGTVVCIGGGVGIAPIYPIAKSLKEAGNKIITILGVRNHDLLFWEKEMNRYSDELVVTTDDGSYGRKGLVTAPLKEILESGRNIDLVIAIGPAMMMRFCSMTTKPSGVKTIVSLNPIMVDATGMCGVCRVSIGGVTKFGCVDGPDFNGHEVDWDLLCSRQAMYKQEENVSYDCYKSGTCGNR